MRKIFSFLFLFIITSSFTIAQSYKILESNSQNIKIEFNFGGKYHLRDTTIDSRVYQMIGGGKASFRKPGEPWVPNFTVNIGIPFSSNPTLQIIQVDKTALENKFILPYPEEDPQIKKMDVNKFDKVIYSTNKPFPEQPALFGADYITRYSRVIPVNISPYQYNPVSHQLLVNKKVIVVINYNYKVSNQLAVNDQLTNNFLKSSVINYSEAVHWTREPQADIMYGGMGYGNYWYNPNKNYFKFYLKEKGVYRVSFDQLVAAGVPIGGGIQSDKLDLINDGITVPIDVVDGGDGMFNSGDYFQFVGYPPTSTQYCTMNIYNNSNVYWFSYQSDSLSSRYVTKSGYPQTWDQTFNMDYHTIHYEQDSLFERLGYATNDHRDFWFWGKATAQEGQSTGGFEYGFPGLENMNLDQHIVKFRIAMQGMTTSGLCQNNHDAEIQLTNQLIGHALWGDQNNIVYEKDLYVSNDSIHIYPEGNYLDVFVRGNTCETSDEIRVNWFEFQYWRNSETHGDHFDFISPPGATGVIRYWLSLWNQDNMKIYIPARSEVIPDPEIRNDQWQSVLFVDSLNQKVEYFCSASNYFLSPDSIKEDISSDLRNPANGADYIIITHPDFMEAAQRLKVLRENQYPDSEITTPRVKIVDVNQIYDEFSFGLLDPVALRDFVKYAFENWETPAPVYVVLIGDMSHDYRQLLSTSKKNFIPSTTIFAPGYGIAESDNKIVAVEGTDANPELVIGRLSCESPTGAGVLLDKLENYPQDIGKEWKQDVMLAASGLSIEDERSFGFNEASNFLADEFLIPNGIHPSRVYNFPTNAHDSLYMGGGPKIRDEINEGVILGNYYGHGGGFQWDLIFTNDDIALLQNDGRLPVILSVTCYTAHFDDQDVFGEIFNRLPGRGSIGFFGNIGLTYWGIGNVIDTLIFNDVFNNKNYDIGKAIFNAKNLVSGTGYFGEQISLLTYLGDPGLKLALPDKPDFVIKPSDISLSEENPLVNDTVLIKAKIRNLGVVFRGDTINVQFFADAPDTSYLIATSRLSSFGEDDSALVNWIPQKTALYNITVKVNELDPIPENDHSDNTASASFAVYDLSEANVLYPQDGFSTSQNLVKFRFVDIGHYIDMDLNYSIEIDTSLGFSSPIISSDEIHPTDGLLDWNSPQLSQGSYFWRTRIFNGTNYGAWSKIRSFSIMSSAKNGFYAANREMRLFNIYNLNFSDSSLQLNTSVLPPRPTKTTLINDISINDPVLDTVNLTTITTDGTYIYFGNIWYFALRFNPEGKSKIYKFGTGYNGTVEGQFYGEIPNFYGRIANSITYHSDGYIYVAESDPHSLLRLNPTTGDTSRISIPDGLLDYEHGRPVPGSFFIASDSQYVYNLTLFDSLGNRRYVLRIFNPTNNWQLVRPDIELLSSSFAGFTSFFVSDGYIYPTEDEYHNYMRRIRISDGYFEDEWDVYRPWQNYYAWCYDWAHDSEVASVFDQYNYGSVVKLSRFRGKHVDANGNFTTQDIGPASNWKTLTYDLHENSSGSFSNILFGLNKTTKNYDTLAVDIPANYSIQNVPASDYKYLRLYFKMTDTTFNTANPMQFRNLNVDYDGLPEIMITKNDLNVSPDSVLQGLNTNMHFSVKNIGFVPADNISLKFYLNDLDSIFYSSSINLKPDSSASLDHTFSTTPLIFDNSIKAIADYPNSEYFTFNNITKHAFYVVRDSTNPVFNITFDGKEILDGDIVSSRPEIKITLKDNSPLPLDTSLFTIIFDNIPLNFSRSDVRFDTTGYPNAEANLTWKTEYPFSDGKHTLEVLAKDPSGNFFDTTSFRINFYVFTEYDLKEVYNYPNPFKDGTYFTFIVTGDKLPDQLYVKIYTVAGRLIKTLNITSSELGTDLGFKRIYWDGKDEDGDNIANGVYFYKMIYKVKDVVRTVTQKLAKVR